MELKEGATYVCANGVLQEIVPEQTRKLASLFKTKWPHFFSDMSVEYFVSHYYPHSVEKIIDVEPSGDFSTNWLYITASVQKKGILDTIIIVEHLLDFMLYADIHRESEKDFLRIHVVDMETGEQTYRDIEMFEYFTDSRYLKQFPGDLVVHLAQKAMEHYIIRYDTCLLQQNIRRVSEKLSSYVRSV